MKGVISKSDNKLFEQLRFVKFTKLLIFKLVMLLPEQFSIFKLFPKN